MAELVRESELKNWWWTCKDEEFVTEIFEALANRRKSARSQRAKMTVYDRGTRMSEAVAAATISVKNNYETPAQGRLRLREILKQNDISPQYEDVSVLLKHHLELENGIRIGLIREVDSVDKRHERYRELLHQELIHQEELGMYHHVHVEAGPESHLLVRNQLRRDLACYALPHPFVLILPRIQRIYAIGGLSESGKSKVSAELAAFHGTVAHRLKMAYFLDAASEKSREDVYRLSEKEQAYALLDEIQAYSQAHYWLRFLTIESVHRFESTRWLKTWLSAKMQIIYVDAPEDVRRIRSEDCPKDFDQKDSTKLSRGADRVKEIADLALNNATAMDVAVGV